ncbi:MAG: hypothetical protein P8X74_20835 [Reinekea sp.]
MPPQNWGEPMGAPAIFEKRIEIKLLHPASTEGVTDSGKNQVLCLISLMLFQIRQLIEIVHLIRTGTFARFCTVLLSACPIGSACPVSSG